MLIWGPLIFFEKYSHLNKIHKYSYIYADLSLSDMGKDETYTQLTLLEKKAYTLLAAAKALHHSFDPRMNLKYNLFIKLHDWLNV